MNIIQVLVMWILLTVFAVMNTASNQINIAKFKDNSNERLPASQEQVVTEKSSK